MLYLNTELSTTQFFLRFMQKKLQKKSQYGSKSRYHKDFFGKKIFNHDKK